MSDQDTASRKVADVHVSKDRQFESLFDSGYSTGTLSSTNIDPSSVPSASSLSPSQCKPSPKPTSDTKATKISIAAATTDSGLCIDSDLHLSSITNESIESTLTPTPQPESVCNENITWNSLAAFTPDQEGDSLLHLAIVKGHTSWALKIIQQCPDPNLLDMQNNFHQTPLHLATLTGQSDLVRRLLIAGATLDLRNNIGNTALHIACEEGNLDVVKSILEPISSTELTEARQAFYKPQVETIGLIGLIHNMNHEGLTCVHLATKSGNKKLLEYLNSSGANMNIREGKSGWTALHLAVSSARDDLVQSLLTFSQVNINLSNYSGCTPLKLSARLENWFRNNPTYKSQVTSVCKIMVLLLEAGALMHDGNRLHCIHSDTENSDTSEDELEDDEDDDEEDDDDGGDDGEPEEDENHHQLHDEPRGQEQQQQQQQQQNGANGEQQQHQPAQLQASTQLKQ